MLNTKKIIKIIVVEGISELQFLDFLISNFCQPNCIKPSENTKLKELIKQKTIVKKNVYVDQEKSLLALDFEGKPNITEKNISNVLSVINETDSGLEFEILIIVDNDADPTKTAKDFKKIIGKLKIIAEDSQKNININDRYQLKSIQTLTLPNETSTGCLESLIIEICPKEDFRCFDLLINCIKELPSAKRPNDNLIAKLKLNHYNTFFNDEDKKNVSTSIENILKNTQKKYEKDKKDFLSHIKQNQNIANIIAKISTFINQ
jgi:hypothetical protein